MLNGIDYKEYGWVKVSIQKKVLLNTGSQIYMALLSVVTLPFYISILGKPAYGLIAFFLQLQTVISLLDIGISATVARNTTLFKAGKLDRNEFFSSANSIEVLFYLLGITILTLGFWHSDWITHSWLQLDDFNAATAMLAVQLMTVVVVCRWLQTFYRAVIFGAERIEWLSWFNIAFSSVRVVLVIPYLHLINGDIVDFFQYQIVMNLLELAALAMMSSKQLGYRAHERLGLVQFSTVKAAIRSSAVIGVTSVLWALMAQSDKVLASGLVTLTGYAAYSIVITVASVLVLLSAPLIYAIGPMMSRLVAEQQHQEAVMLFRNASLFVALVLVSAFTVVLCFSEPLLLAWTADADLVQLALPLLPVYLTGTLFFALNYLSYSICYAFGDFRLRLKLSAIALGCYLPAQGIAALFASQHGLIYSWMLLNILFFFGAQPLLYKKLQPGLFIRSFFHDLLLPAIGCASVVVIALNVELHALSWWQVVLFCGLMFVCSFSAGVLSSRARTFVRPMFARVTRSIGHVR